MTIQRKPLFVTAPTKHPPLQLDLSRNIAVLLAAIGTLHPQSALDPTFYKKPQQQIEHFRNLAALSVAEPGKSKPSPQEPTFFKRSIPQSDVYQNIAATLPVVVPVQPVQRAPFFINTNFHQWAAPDIDPNIAIGVISLAGVLNHPVEPSFYPRKPPQIDVIYNIALALVASQTTMTATDSLPAKIWPQIDVFPNVAVNFAVVAYEPPSPIDPPPPKRYFTQIDLYPNIALKGVEPARVFPALEWVLPSRSFKWPVPDLPVNMAPSVPRVFNYAPEPTLTKRLWASFDQYRNATALAPTEKIPLIEPIDPWVNKRYPPQVEVFQNKAIYVAPGMVPVLFQAPDPTILKVKWGSLDVFPNVAAAASSYPYAPPPVAPPPEISEWTTDATQVTADTINFTCDGSNLIAGGGLPTDPTPKESSGSGNPGPAVNVSQNLRF